MDSLAPNVGRGVPEKKQPGANDFSALWKKDAVRWATMQAAPEKQELQLQETWLGSLDGD